MSTSLLLESPFVDVFVNFSYKGLVNPYEEKDIYIIPERIYNKNKRMYQKVSDVFLIDHKKPLDNGSWRGGRYEFTNAIDYHRIDINDINSPIVIGRWIAAKMMKKVF